MRLAQKNCRYRLRHMRVTFFVGVLMMTTVAIAEELAVFGSGTKDEPQLMLNRHLKRLAHAALERRKAEYERLKSPEQIATYQERLREFFLQSIGGIPERTPLNAKVVGELARDDYRIEKVIFESQPRHYVTGVLYLPATEGPYPAVLLPCGHSRNGKASGAYQRAGILLAKNGMAAFCYDPIGQGERYQILDAEGKPKYKPTTEHTILGVANILLGRNTASYRIYDGMRALDYLQSREDIDGKRIGCSGCSGGGTLTSYLMSLDSRITCTAPSCYLTSLERLIDTLGPQDAEQNIFAAVAFGMDHADYVIMHAPKPILMCTATHDFFDIIGAWDTFREAKRIYTRLGYPERASLVETDSRHGYGRAHREAMVRWMRRWLLGIDDAINEPDFDVFTEEELQCTPQGQVMLMEGARSVIDINVAMNAHLAEDRQEFWQATPTAEALQRVRDIAGIQHPDDIPEARAEVVDTVERESYRIDKLLLHVEDDVLLPALACVPPEMKGGPCLYLHGKGKEVDAEPGGPIEKLVLEGKLVLAVDLRGIGETAGRQFENYFLAYLLGKSYVGMRTGDILSCARLLSTYLTDGKAHQVDLIAIGQTGPPAIHAAALEPELFASLTLRNTLTSWSRLVDSPSSIGQLVHTVHGALKSYDLPDLLALLPADKVTIEKLPVSEPSGEGAEGTE